MSRSRAFGGLGGQKKNGKKIKDVQILLVEYEDKMIFLIFQVVVEV